MKEKTMRKLVIALLVALLFMSCNVGISERNAAEGAWADVQAQLQRRSDLIPNLVNTVKAAVAAEKDILEGVLNARAAATQIRVNIDDAESMAQYQRAQGDLSQALGRLLSITENYPELKSIEGFSDLQVQLEGTENRIAKARKDFNDAVRKYNTSITMWPNRVFAGSQTKMSYFEASEAAQAAPQVAF
jgi:LemA protein